MNKFMLNETSYHGSGAISEIPSEIQSRGFGKSICRVRPRFGKIRCFEKRLPT